MKGNHKHGHAAKGHESPTYRTWLAMLNRCTNPKQGNYRYYGGRGISVCERWTTFAHFLADVGERPSGATLDRINNDIGYEPSNCRWSQHTVQMRNTRSNRMLTYNGETMCLSAWAMRYGMNRERLKQRLERGWPLHKALTLPKQSI